MRGAERSGPLPKSTQKAKERTPRAARKTRAAAGEKTKTRAASKAGGDAAMPRGLWSGTLSFGLVTIPVQLYAATRSTRRSLRMLSAAGTPLSRRYFSETGKALDSDDLARGYELEDGGFVLVEDDELERLLPDQSRDIDLSRFVPQDAIPPLYFERAYILSPGDGGSSAYRLLAATMERLEKVGIASFVMRERQYVVAISAHNGVLWAETLRFSDELRSKDSIGLKAHDPSESSLREMRGALKRLAKPRLSQRELEDSYWQRLEKLVAKKKADQRDVVTAGAEENEPESTAEVIDLMEVLKRSLAKSRAS
jgi:DNA end-binding protein Ku